MVEVNGLSYWHTKEKSCFTGLNFSLDQNDSLAIFGLNGQGKSTLLYTLVGVLKPRSGSVKLMDKFTLLEQSYNTIFNYKVLDVILLGADVGLFRIPSLDDAKFAEEIAANLGITHLLDKSFNALSGGEKKLVMFAKILTSKSRILLLDEPLAELDIKNQNKILSTMINLGKNHNIIFTSHDPNQAILVANKTLILYKDSYIFGETKSVLNSENLSKLYSMKFKMIDLKIRSKNISNFLPIYSVI